MCDVFAPYSYEKRELFLDELDTIMSVLSPEQVNTHVINALGIFVDEKDELKAKFLQKAPAVCRFLCEADQEKAMNAIIINVLPYFSVLLKKNCEIVKYYTPLTVDCRSSKELLRL